MSHTLTLFIILSITVVASPGPGVLLTVMTTLEEGGRKPPWCIGGLACGTFILAMIAVGGLGAILSAPLYLHLFRRLAHFIFSGLVSKVSGSLR